MTTLIIQMCMLIGTSPVCTPIHKASTASMVECVAVALRVERNNPAGTYVMCVGKQP